MQNWKILTPGEHLTVDPESGARAIVRDTRASGESRFLWSVIPFDQLDPIAEGRTGDLTRARSIAEVALNVYLEDQLDAQLAPKLAPNC
jgi:hypothetical protein